MSDDDNEAVIADFKKTWSVNRTVAGPPPAIG
jgi:hypothetical protein